MCLYVFDEFVYDVFGVLVVGYVVDVEEVGEYLFIFGGVDDFGVKLYVVVLCVVVFDGGDGGVFGVGYYLVVLWKLCY